MSLRETVIVILAADATTRAVDRTAPFLVCAQGRGRKGVYEDEPDVIAQMRRGERKARFEAEWVDGGWKFGKRVGNA
jgi:hypothetical protein